MTELEFREIVLASENSGLAQDVLSDVLEELGLPRYCTESLKGSVLRVDYYPGYTDGRYYWSWLDKSEGRGWMYLPKDVFDKLDGHTGDPGRPYHLTIKRYVSRLEAYLALFRELQS